MSKRKSKRTRVRLCRICASPYRKEIEERVLEKNETKYSVAKAYAEAFGLEFKYIYQAMKIHFLRHLDRPFQEYEEAPAISFELASKILLKEGMADRKRLSPKEKLDMAQKLERAVIANKQVKTQEDALKLAAAKFFGGFNEEGDMIEGKEITEDGTPKLPETISTNKK